MPIAMAMAMVTTTGISDEDGWVRASASTTGRVASGGGEGG